MNWSEITVYTSKEAIETVSAIMNEMGAEGVVIEDEEDFLTFLEDNRSRWDYVDEELMKQKHCETNVKTYVECNEEGFEIYKRIENAIFKLKLTDKENKFGRLEVTCSQRDDSEWKDKWKEYFKPFSVGEKLFICPAWIEAEAPKGRCLIKLETGQLFGTGLHATTRLCLNSLEKYITEGSSVLDLGTGSGILAVSANALGGKPVRAIDIDDGVYKTFQNNIEINGLNKDDFEVLAADVLKDKNMMAGKVKKYDVVIANIVADVIIALSYTVSEFLKEKGIFIVSGIINERADEVREKLIDNGFKIICENTLDGWTEFELTK